MLLDILNTSNKLSNDSSVFFLLQVILSLGMCPKLVGFVMNILAKLINKQVCMFDYMLFICNITLIFPSCMIYVNINIIIIDYFSDGVSALLF